jgi:hypothetical protein
MLPPRFNLFALQLPPRFNFFALPLPPRFSFFALPLHFFVLPLPFFALTLYAGFEPPGRSLVQFLEMLLQGGTALVWRELTEESRNLREGQYFAKGIFWCGRHTGWVVLSSEEKRIWEGKEEREEERVASISSHWWRGPRLYKGRPIRRGVRHNCRHVSCHEIAYVSSFVATS